MYDSGAVEGSEHWNIRTMRDREGELVEEMKKYQLEMLGASETKVRVYKQ